jgi:hypothetical protein
MRMRSRVPLLLSLLLLPATWQCGGDTGSSGGTPTPNASSCDYRSAGVSGALYCQEYVGDATVLAAYKSACGQTSGTVWASVGCPRTGSVGGCTNTTSGITITNWFYAGGAYANAAAVMASCSQDGKSTYVAP